MIHIYIQSESSRPVLDVFSYKKVGLPLLCFGLNRRSRNGSAGGSTRAGGGGGHVCRLEEAVENHLVILDLVVSLAARSCILFAIICRSDYNDQSP